MIGYIKGKVTDITDNAIVLEKDGIGFFIYTSQLVIANLSMNQETVTIYTHMHVREDEISLFGFLSKEELEMFRMLGCIIHFIGFVCAGFDLRNCFGRYVFHKKSKWNWCERCRQNYYGIKR